MSEKQGRGLEAEVIRVVRYASTRSSWKLVPVMPNLLRISRKLEFLVRDLESSPTQPAPGELNRLSRNIYAMQQPFAAPIFRGTLNRIDRLNLRLASFAEGAYMATSPDFQEPAATKTGPAAENKAKASLARSA